MTNEITADITRTEKTPPWSVTPGQDKPNSWYVTLHYQGRTMSLDFFTGSKHPTPTVKDVLETLTIDAGSVENDDLDDLLAEVPFSRALAVNAAVRQQTAQLRTLLGDDYVTFMAVAGYEVDPTPPPAPDPIVAKITFWRDNLLANAAVYRARAAGAPNYEGNGSSPQFWARHADDAEARADDMTAVLDLINEKGI